MDHDRQLSLTASSTLVELLFATHVFCAFFDGERILLENTVPVAILVRNLPVSTWPLTFYCDLYRSGGTVAALILYTFV